MALREVSIEELANLNSENQKTELYLAFTENPPIVFQCVVNQEFPTHDQVYEFLFGTVTGDVADVLPGMTVWIGSSAGKYDYGQARVRKAWTADPAYVCEASEISWANERHITVVDEMGIWPKHVYIDENEAVFMDRDIEFTDQHINFAPVPIMGCNAVLDVASYPAQVRFPETDRSWVFDSTIASWAWTATAGTFDDDTSANPILTINSYPPNGLIRIGGTPTSAAGASFTGYRYIKVYDATHRPVKVFQLGSCHGEYESGGFSFQVTMYTDTTRSQIRDRAPIALIANDYYGNDALHIGQLENRENIVANGWVNGETIVYDPSGGTVTFQVEGPQYWLNKINGYPSGVKMAAKTPNAWTIMPGLTVDRALWHFLHWRTTTTAVLDVTLTGDTRYASELKSPQSSLWGQITEIAATSIMATGGFDQYGRLFIGIDAQMIPVAERTSIPTIQTILPIHWENVIQIERRTVAEIALLYFSGIAVDAAGKGKSYFSLSPGHVFRRYGAVQQIERMLLSSQEQSNEMCGLYSGWKNNQYPRIGVNLAQNNRMFTLFPAQYAHIDIAETDTERGIVRSFDLVPRGVNFAWDAESGVMSTEITFEAATLPDLSTNGDVPGIINPGEIVQPPEGGVELPPVTTIVLPPTENNTQRPRVVVIAGTLGVFYTENGDEEDPADIEWFPMNDGLADDELNQIAQLVVTPGGILYALIGNQKIMTSIGLGWPWEQFADTSIYTGGLGSGCVFAGLGVNPNVTDEIAVFGGRPWSWPYDGNIGTFQLAIGGSGTPLTPASGGINYPRLFGAAVLYSDNKWIVHDQQGTGILGSIPAPFTISFDSGGTLTSATGAPGASASTEYGCAVGTSDVVYRWQAAGGLYRVTTSGTVFSAALGGINPNTPQAISPSPDGTILMGSSGTTPYLSTDGGDTWESIADTVPIGPHAWENCGDDNRWLFAGGTVMRFTADLGETYEEMEGNLGYIAPLINIYFIRFIE